MKKMIKNLMLVAVAAMAFVACSQEGNEVNILPKQTIFEFTANMQDDTRSQFTGEQDGAYLSKWEGSEVATIVVSNGDTTVMGTATIKEGTVNGDEATFVATLNGEVPQNGGTINVYVGNWYDNGSETNALAPTQQYPNEKSVDSASHILKATTTYEGNTIPTELNLDFGHAIAYGRLTIPFDGDDIDNVVVMINGIGYNVNPQYKDIPNPAVIWFACPEMAVETITVDATVNGMEFTQTVDMTGMGKKFTVGKVVRFSMNNFTAKPFEADYTATEFVGNGISTVSGGNFFDVKGEDFSFKLHVASAQSTQFTISEGVYELQGSVMATSGTKASATDAIFDGTSVNLVLNESDSRSGSMIVTLDETTGNYTINMYLVSNDGRSFKVTYTGEITEPKSDVVELNTISKGTYNSDLGYYQFNLSDGTNNNRLILYIGDKNATQYSINANDYTLASKTYLYSGNYFTADTIYSNGASLGRATAGDLNVVKDGNNYSMTFKLTATNGACEFVANVTLVEPTKLATPAVTANVDGNSATLTWDAIANAASYTVKYGDKTETVTTNYIELSDLTWETTYTVTVVANPADETLNYASDASTPVNVVVGSNPDAGGGDEPGTGGDEGPVTYNPWACTATLGAGNFFSGYTVTLVGTGENDDTLELSGVKINNVDGNVTAKRGDETGTGTARIDSNSYNVVFNVTIGNVTYIGTSSNKVG